MARDATEFHRLSADTEWNKRAQHQHSSEDNEDTEDELEWVKPASGLDDLTGLCIQIDNCPTKRHGSALKTSLGLFKHAVHSRTQNPSNLTRSAQAYRMHKITDTSQCYVWQRVSRSLPQEDAR